MFKPTGSGMFKLESGNNCFWYDNSTTKVYYEFRNEGKVELEEDEIPLKIKEMIEELTAQ